MILAEESTSLQLRYLDTLRTISQEQNSTILVPVPIDIFEAFRDKKLKKGGQQEAA